MDSITIDFTEFFRDQTMEETVQVLDDMLVMLVIYTEENGINENLSHQYLTIRGLRDTLMMYESK